VGVEPACEASRRLWPAEPEPLSDADIEADQFVQVGLALDPFGHEVEAE
jgi:hypothetical protein